MFHRIPLTLVVVFVALAHASETSAQTYSTRKARRQFITISYDWLNTDSPIPWTIASSRFR